MLLGVGISLLASAIYLYTAKRLLPPFSPHTRDPQLRGEPIKLSTRKRVL
jgi:hypothetical protein